MPSDHKPITEAELKEMERRARWIRHAAPVMSADYDQLIAEVRRLRAIMEWYATPGNWRRPGGPIDLTTFNIVWDPPAMGSDAEHGYTRARKALGWSEPPEPCDNPSCDGVKDDKTFGDAHRCFKDGRWLDDGSEM